MARCVPSQAFILFAIAVVASFDKSAGAQESGNHTSAAELKILKTFHIGGKGNWDALLVDPDAHRLYIARGTRVMVLDSEEGTSLGEVGELQGAHGVALAKGHNLGFATSGQENTVVVFDLGTLKTIKRIKAGQNPDTILYDPASQKVFAFCGRSGEAAIIDPANLEQEPVLLPVGSKLEFGVADGGGRVYVNDEKKNEVVAIDSKEQKVVAHWPLAPAEEPTGLAIDKEHHRLFAGCGNKKMAVVDSDTGKLLATVDIGAGVDGVEFDPQLGAVSANGRDGTISVVREGPAGQFTVVQTLNTVKSARTITVDTKSHRLFLPATVEGENGAASEFGIMVVGLAAGN